jgi:hypothetical protein
VTERPWHYLKMNHGNRIPRHHVMLDTEAWRRRDGHRETQDFRLAVAHFYAGPKGRPSKERTGRFTDPVQLWAAVSAHASPRHRTVVWAHNLGYDVRISAALTTLPRLGWILTGHNMAQRGTWLSWQRGDTSMVMVDSSSVFPTTLAQVGKTLGMSKVELPATPDDEEALWARCEQDVLILRASVLAYLRWLEREDLGNWQMTGTGQGFAAFRHRFMTHRMLVHTDEDALAAERRAMWTGRCEAFWHGTMLREVLHEWDLTTAYARVARDHRVPTRLLGPCSVVGAWPGPKQRRDMAILAECTVDTAVPVAPTRHEGRVLWPIGTFETCLWDVEIDELVQAGSRVSVGRAWRYRTAPALQPMAEWILTRLEAADSEVPAWEKMILKHWSRAWIGRFGMSYHRWEATGRMPTMDTRRWMCVDNRYGTTYDMIQVGQDVFSDNGEEPWDDAMPSVTGYIMACARARLWQIIRSLPKEAVLYVDTDAVFVHDSHYGAVAAFARDNPHLALRLKKSWDGFSVLGPRQLITGPEVRVSGLPRRAQRTGRQTFTGQQWESLPKALTEGRWESVRIIDRAFTLRGVDRRRRATASGWTEPHVLGAPAAPQA